MAFFLNAIRFCLSSFLFKMCFVLLMRVRNSMILNHPGPTQGRTTPSKRRKSPPPQIINILSISPFKGGVPQRGEVVVLHSLQDWLMLTLKSLFNFCHYKIRTIPICFLTFSLRISALMYRSLIFPISRICHPVNNQFLTA